MAQMFLIKYTGTTIQACCFPYVFSSAEKAQQFIDEACYYPDEFVVIEAENMDELEEGAGCTKDTIEKVVSEKVERLLQSKLQ